MTAVLDKEVGKVIERLFGEPIHLADARAHPMQSSCALTEISLRGPAGERRELVLKDLSHRSRHSAPGFLADEHREIEAYRLLRGQGLHLPGCVGAEVDPVRGRYWLFIERVEGVPLWQSGDRLAWRAAAEWLADLQELAPLPEGRPWLRYDRDYYAGWLERALALAPDAGLAALKCAYARAADRLGRAEPVIVHGDYYPSNLIVSSQPAAGVCALDFEMVGMGAPVIDLAALTTGLPEPLCRQVVDAYRRRQRTPLPAPEFEELLLCARLHLAIRWLGWMPNWHPPEHQRFDWVAEAHATAAALEQRG